MRQRYLAHFGPARAKGVERILAQLGNARIERLREVLARLPDHDTLQIIRVRRGISIDRTVRTRRIARIAPRDHLECDRGILHHRTEHTDLVERRCEGDEPKAADATVRRLHTHDAAVPVSYTHLTLPTKRIV